MSGAQTSTFPNQNELLAANAQQLANYYAPERNRLLNLQSQQAIAGHDMEVVARAASGLFTNYTTPEARAAAYPGMIRGLQAQGAAMNAPAVYPGDEAARHLISLGIPAATQYEQQGVRDAATAFRTSLTGGPPAATPAPGAAPGTYTSTVIASEGTGKNPRSSATGTGQFIDSTWKAFADANPQLFAGKTPEQIMASRSDPALGATAVDWLAQQNAPVLQRAGVAPTGQSLNLAHYLGAVPAAAVMQAQDGERIADVLTRSIGAERTAQYLQANPELATATAGSLRGRYANVPNPAFLGSPKPVQVAGPGAPTATTPPAPAPGSVAAQTAGLVVPQGVTPPPGVTPPVPAPAAPAATPAPVAPAAPAATPAPGAQAPVLPPLPDAPPPVNPATGLNAAQTQSLSARALLARTPQDLAKLEAEAQTYKDRNIAANKEYEQAVYTRKEKAEADARAVEAQRLATEANMRGWRADLREQEKADRERAKENLPFPGHDPLSAQKNILWKGSQPGGDTSTPEYRDAYQAVKYQAAPNGSVIQRDMPWAPPTGKGAETMKPPTFIAQPSDAARNEVRKADNEAILISQAIDHYVDVFEKSGGTSWNAFFDNPTSPQAQQLLGAFNAMKTVLRSPVYFNTGVLQPAEMGMIKEDLVAPQTIRGLFATPQALASRLGEIKLAVITRQDQELRSIGLPGSIVRNDKEFEALPPGATFYDRDGHLRQKPEAK